jgi:hypothetical protein
MWRFGVLLPAVQATVEGRCALARVWTGVFVLGFATARRASGGPILNDAGLFRQKTRVISVYYGQARFDGLSEPVPHALAAKCHRSESAPPWARVAKSWPAVVQCFPVAHSCALQAGESGSDAARAESRDRFYNAGMARFLIIAGLLLVAAGIAVAYLPWVFGWFGKLPGDIRIERENGVFVFPVTSMLLVSGVLSLLLTLWFRR